MGKPKEKPKIALPSPDRVDGGKALVEKIARAKARLAKVESAAGGAGSNPRYRAAKKRVKRSQRRLRETLKYAAQRAKPAPAGGETATPAS